MNINYLCTHSNPQNESLATLEPVTQDSPLARRRRGAQPGNKNARTHGFYSKHFVENARKDLRAAANELSGLDRELYLTVWRTQLVFKNDPDNIAVQEKATAELINLVRLKYDVGVKDVDGITNALQKMAYDISLPQEVIHRLRQSW